MPCCGPEELGVVHLLEATCVLLTDGVPTTEDEHGGPGVVGVHDPGHRVGNTGACSDGNDSELACEARVGLGSVRSRLLMAHVDDVDAFEDTTVEDGDDMTSGQGEDHVNAFSLEGPRQQLASVDLVHGSSQSANRRGCSRYAKLPAAAGAPAQLSVCISIPATVAVFMLTDAPVTAFTR